MKLTNSSRVIEHFTNTSSNRPPNKHMLQLIRRFLRNFNFCKQNVTSIIK